MPDLRCADCDVEIDLERYRRKVPRCDSCEVDAVLAQLEDPPVLTVPASFTYIRTKGKP